MAVRFYLDHRPNPKTGEVYVRVSIHIKSERLISTLGYTVSPEAWIQDEERVDPKFHNAKGATAKMINSRIKAIRAHFDAMDVLATERPSQETLVKELAAITGSTRGKGIGEKKEKTVVPKVLPAFEEFIREE